MVVRAAGEVCDGVNILSWWGIISDEGFIPPDISFSAVDRRGRVENGEGKIAPVGGEGWVAVVRMCSRMDGVAAKIAAPSSRTNWAISEERPGYRVVAASMSGKYSMRTVKP